MSCPHGNPIGGCDTCDEVDAAFEAGKRSALAEQQEPVAWLVYENWRKHSLFFTEEGAEDFKNAAQREDDLSGNLARWKAKPLYTSPPAQRKPLTDEEQIAEALRRHSLTLVKTAKGYDVMSLGHITAHGITKGTK